MLVTPLGSGQTIRWFPGGSLAAAGSWQQAAGRLLAGTARNVKERSDTCYFVHKKSSSYDYTENVFLYKFQFHVWLVFLVIYIYIDRQIKTL